MTGPLVGAPQIFTSSLVLTRIGITLIFPGTSRLGVDLLHTPLLLLEVLFGDLHLVDDYVLDAASEGGRVVGQNFLWRKKIC